MTTPSNAVVSTPSLVLLPGLDGTGRMFDSFVRERPANQDVHIVEYPGDRHSTYDELFEQVLNALPTNRPYFLLGESFSGPLAIRAAALQPAGLQGVILCASFAASPTPWYARWPSLYTSSVVRMLIWLEALTMQALLGRCSEEMRRLAGEATDSVCPRVLAARVRATMRVDVTRELQEMQVPLMYLAGRWDLVVPRRSQELIRRLRPDVAIRTINGPHALLQTRPTEAWAVVSEWCRQFQSQPLSNFQDSQSWARSA